MVLLREDTNLVLRRKYQSILDTCGKGTLLFAAWSVIKGLMYIFLGDNLVRQFNDVAETESVNRTVLIAFFVFFVLIDLLLHLSVGVMALAEAKGKKTSVIFLIIAGLLILYSLYGIYALFGADVGEYYTLSDRIVTTFVELTSIFNLTEIIIYSLRLRHLPEPSDGSLQGEEAD